jgi:replicative DNA helicase
MRQYKPKETPLGEQSYNMQMGKVMPHDIEAEHAFLGGLIVYYNSIISVVSTMKSSDFYSQVHSTIYSAMVSVFESGEQISALNIIKQLKKNGELEFVGGAKRIAGLTTGDIATQTDKSMLYLIELAKKRELIALGTNIVIKAYNDTSDVFDLVSEMQKGIVEILTFKMSKDTDFGAISHKTLKEIELKGQGVLEGMPSKFKNINELTGGYRKGTLRTVAGRPGMGKSLHLVNEATHLSKQGYNVIIFSLEMPDKEVTKRMMSIGTQIEGYKLDKNILSDDEMLALQKFVINAPNMNIHIDDTGNIDILYLIAQMKKIKMKNEMKDKTKSGLDIVFIDYLQLMKLDNENRNIGLGEITRKLKSLSKELDICIVLYSQLNRAVESRGGDKKPLLSDLKESGSIEEDSDVVEFIYRAEKYGITENEKGESTVGLMELITEKNRQGGSGTSEIKFLPTISTLIDKSNYFSNQNAVSNINDFENQVPKQINIINF